MEKTEETKDLVTSMGMSSAEFGSALISEAQNRKQKERLERSVAVATTILSSLDECSRKIEYFTGWKRTLEGQLAALNAGEFTFDAQGNISYDDKSLNLR